jgi:alkanesulfonate monooxygenase SsuD/methylene tetrahydromethanopterin reductase-like flavin-dependent oxidoreductase (luciferase family)
MEFGLFVEFPSNEQTTQAQIFKDSMELIDAAEDSGSEGIWLAEYHFDPGRSVLSAPVTVAGAVAARTKKVKIGLAVHVLPLRNPVQIAEGIATLDHLSNGRLDFGIGRSAFPQIYQGYGFDYSESRDRFDECLEIILKSGSHSREISISTKTCVWCPSLCRNPIRPSGSAQPRLTPLSWWEGWATQSSSTRPGSPACWI